MRFWLVALAACTTHAPKHGVSIEARHERFAAIRDAAARMGLHNGALLAGIAMSETHLAHCAAEASYACPGPPSPSCDNEPVIAGAGDGSCGAQQGGLGMFQFDAGTYADTLAVYGSDVLTIEGNTEQAVAFVIGKTIASVDGVGDWLGAAAWLDAVPLAKGAPAMEQWARLIACRYNGCCSRSPTCQSRAARYRDYALAAYDEMGSAFWRTADRCTQLPPGGVIDLESSCYVAVGDPRYRKYGSGFGVTEVEWASSTNDPTPLESAEWIVKVAPGTYHVAVLLDGAVERSKAAHYQIVHAGRLDTVTIDQTAATGFAPLGAFEFSGSGDEYVSLGDNTGEAHLPVAFEAVRVTP